MVYGFIGNVSQTDTLFRGARAFNCSVGEGAKKFAGAVEDLYRM